MRSPYLMSTTLVQLHRRESRRCLYTLSDIETPQEVLDPLCHWIGLLEDVLISRGEDPNEPEEPNAQSHT